MNTSLENHKVALITWLSNLEDEAILKQIEAIKIQNQIKHPPKKRVAGSGKVFFSSISQDFNDSLDDVFQDYIKPL